MDHMPGDDYDTADGEDHGKMRTTKKAKSSDKVSPDPGGNDTDGHEETRLCTKPTPTPTQDTPTLTAPTPRLGAESPQAYKERRLGVGLWVRDLGLHVPDDVFTTEMSSNKKHAAAVEAKHTTCTRLRNSVTGQPRD